MNRRVGVTLVAALAAALSLLTAGSGAGVGDYGYRGPTFAGAGSAPSGEKPESKLWWNDGYWWASMWHRASLDYHIFRLDLSTQTWVDTGVALDDRTGTKADTLWDGTHLYVASHVYSESPATGYPSRLYRYSYDPAADTYSLDAGFPVAINDYRTETLVIAKDSTGTLWATWMQGNRVWVNRTTTGDASWGTPFVPAVAGTATAAADDISSLVAFQGNKLGLMWSNQTESKMYFAVHLDGDPGGTWQASRAALQGSGDADDHINLKSLQADGSGRVFAATKTSHGSSSAPLIMLLARDPATGDWSSHVFGRVSDSHTRPIVLLDEEHDVIHMYATGPMEGNSSDGTIYEKTSPADAISFPLGYGTPFIRDAASIDMNNATSTKQNVSSTTGLVVLATNDTTDEYWHNYSPLGTPPPPPPPPPPPAASFTATPLSGTAPLTVSFTDTSTGAPASWSWSFGDGGTSTARNPTHEYVAAGTYTVTLTATNAGGSDSDTLTDLISVSPATSIELTPVADAYTRSSKPSANFGTATTLKVQGGRHTHRTHLTFTVTGLSGPPIRARLRLYTVDSSPVGGDVYTTAAGWTEGGLTWSNQPALATSPIASAGAVNSGTWVEVDVTAALTGSGTYSFALVSADANSAGFSSREGANPPRLVLDLPQ